MAEDCVNQAATLGQLPRRECVTRQLNIHGFHPHPEKFGQLSFYGSDAAAINELMEREPDLRHRCRRSAVCGAEVVWAVRHEMARRWKTCWPAHTRLVPQYKVARRRLRRGIADGAELGTMRLKARQLWLLSRLPATSASRKTRREGSIAEQNASSGA